MTDDELIAQYLNGDTCALETLVDRYMGRVYNLTLHITNDQSAADDATQEAFVRAWRAIRGYRTGMSFKAWLFRIARNAALDWVRKKKDVAFSVLDHDTDASLQFVDTIVDEHPLPDAYAITQESIRHTTALLARLRPDHREIVVLRHTSNLTFEEIGALVRRPLHTVKSQYRRAIAALRECVHQNQ